ncbi:hypothetical protein FMM05_05770 [Flavobacterium zepuense]|uniref:Uncharacterized protein n=1 Tax=Flavobacterium zepuense TaxID=2593302 RepID=A0A552V5K1_9FLAO|nr:hypothetical protein [Flavobacterium zepuense]TRW25729.1 hypothetical protein FMM05_05770 [Flavobacterium zepuense]
MNNFKLNEEHKIKSGLTSPQDVYFENFTERLMQQLPAPEIKVVPLYRRKPVWFSAAAGFVVMLTGGYFLLNNSPQATTQPDTAAIENYLVYQTNVTSYDMIDHLDSQDIKELEASIVLNDDAIKDYLSDEDVYLYE